MTRSLAKRESSGLPRAADHPALGKHGPVNERSAHIPLSDFVCNRSGHRVSHHRQIRINPNTGSAIGVLRSTVRLGGRCQGLSG
jgi:hypothetical protein